MSLEREEGPAIEPDSGETRLPEAPDGEDVPSSSGASRSLVDDIEDLVFDAKTYLDAELSYQKSRASFVGESLKRVIGFAVVAAILVLFAAIGLTVGLIIALTPLITAWGATAVVVGLLLLGAYLLIRNAGAAWGDVMAAVHDEDENGEQEG
ncbi:phage holin family protein [Alteraurantiacibacter aquimixticola]|uniref:Phage holin family protein n=1 Tax=Alteraurantiacibacter aquimixticola TaxID=2489173 RepID=A0A4T3F5B6_9SPHN|nr:phage holin family protein [Alteraurantiacibacter aquimixticola]TIX50016.1 phage holin family protein [Alteraurantiacibacter aquimixticola]